MSPESGWLGFVQQLEGEDKTINKSDKVLSVRDLTLHGLVLHGSNVFESCGRMIPPNAYFPSSGYSGTIWRFGAGWRTGATLLFTVTGTTSPRFTVTIPSITVSRSGATPAFLFIWRKGNKGH